MDADWLSAFGLVRAPEESSEDFERRAIDVLQLMSPRPVTLRDLCDYAAYHAGRGARVEGRDFGERRVELTVRLPRHRRLFHWQRKRVRRRVWQEVNEAREVNFVITVQVP